MQKNTYNLGLALGNTMSIIACYSDNPIDPQEINATAVSHLQNSLASGGTLRGILLSTVEGIKEDCNVEAVLVKADSVCAIRKM